ncbi:MAG: AmmeMemoRadiSam system protein B [Candidatus Cloacimonadaceae bacterium]
MTRKAIFAGSFYDNSPARLRQEIKDWIDKAQLNDIRKDIIGVICPHAGYMYSGFCAAHSYKLLSQKKFKTAIIIHPSHRGNHFSFSVSPFKHYETPLGNLTLNDKMAESLFAQGAEVIDNWYHQNEHSMEVQLPFLAYLNPEVRVVPIMIGNQNKNVSVRLSEILSGLPDEETVVIVSTDLSHYHTAQEAEKMDRKLIENIVALNTEDFYNNIRNGKTEACGFAGIMTLMHLAEKFVGSELKELLYTHSGAASGDFSQVVGYLSAALLKG